jgi:Tol biopolymer transport system component
VFDSILNKAPVPPAQLNPEAPAELERIIGKALEKQRELRYQSAKEILVDLRRLQRDTASGKTATQTAAVIAKPRALSRLMAASAAAALLGAATLLYVFRASSPPPQTVHQQITFVGDAVSPAISPDGKLVVYVTGRLGQGRKLMLQDLKGGQAIELFKDASMGLPRWSPDGSEIAVSASGTSGNQNLILIPRLGGASRRIVRAAYVCWSQDGRQLATAFQDERGFRVIDKETGGVKAIPLAGVQWLFDLDWSPVSNLVAVLTRLDSGRSIIWTVRPDGSQQRPVVDEEDFVSSVRWSPVGDELYFLHGPSTGNQAISKIAIDPESGETRGPPAALLTGLQVGQGFTISADGTRLAYIRTQAHSNLWLAEVENPHGKAPVKPLTSGTATFRSLSISPDGKWLAFSKGQFLFKMPMDGGAPTQLTFSGAAHGGTAWSPDGKRIAFGSAEGGTNTPCCDTTLNSLARWPRALSRVPGTHISIVDAEGGNPRQLVNTKKSEGTDITWWPGREILYQKLETLNYAMVDPETEEEKPLVQDESVGWMYFPKYAPDGKKVVVMWNRRPSPIDLAERIRTSPNEAYVGLWLISLVDHSAGTLHAGWFLPAGWSPDARLVYASPRNGNTIVSIPAGGGDLQTVATLPGEIMDAVVTPDGKQIVSTVIDEKSDVWLVENFDPSHRNKEFTKLLRFLSPLSR